MPIGTLRGPLAAGHLLTPFPLELGLESSLDRLIIKPSFVDGVLHVARKAAEELAYIAKARVPAYKDVAAPVSVLSGLPWSPAPVAWLRLA